MQLKPYNTFGIAASCHFFEQIHTIAELQKRLTPAILTETLLPLRILGSGSNVLFTTQVLKGTIWHNCLRGISLVKETDEQVWIKAASGEIWHDLVLYALQNNWGGIENLSLIPGTVGAAPVQNIGAYGVELCEVFDSLEAMHLQTGQLTHFSLADCQFAYRDSIFKREAKNQYFITAVTIRLDKKHVLKLQYGDIKQTLLAMNVDIDKATIQQISAAVCHIRQSKLPDPKQLGNAGSFFKNPELPAAQVQALRQQFPELPAYPLPDKRAKIPAAWLIEQCGWRGKRLGDAGVHENHALVLVNYGNAQGAELWQLAQQIQQEVKNKFGIDIMPEVNVWE